MAVTNAGATPLTFTNLPIGVQVTNITDTSADWASVSNSTYFYDKADGLVHFKNSSGVVLELFSASGGLTNFTEAANTAAPNATIPVNSLTVTGATTNIDVAIVPKGTGSILAQIPNSASTGGNKRGINSVDLQTSRNLATQVASGENSLIGNGFRNTASGQYSSVLNGVNNLAASIQGVILGGNANSVNTSADKSVIGGGESNTVSGTFSSILGGEGNLVQNASDHSTVVGGSWNTASGSHASVFSATYSRASRNYSTVISGYWGDTRNCYGAVVFSGANSSFATGFTAGGGYQQSRLVVLSRATTDATPTILTANGSAYDGSNVLQVITKGSYLVKGSVIAYSNASNLSNAWEFTAVIKNPAGTPSIVGTPIISNIASDAGASTWAISITADATTTSLKVEVTGQASTTIRWVAKLNSTEVAYQ